MQVAGTGSGIWLQAAVLPDKRHRMLLVNRSLQVSHQLKDILKLESTYSGSQKYVPTLQAMSATPSLLQLG